MSHPDYSLINNGDLKLFMADVSETVGGSGVTADTPPIKSVKGFCTIGMPPGGREIDNRKRKDSGKVEYFSF